MVDETLKELWDIKDNIAKECGYDIEKLVIYLRQKEKSGIGNIPYNLEEIELKQKISTI